VMNITDNQAEYAQKVCDVMRQEGLRVTADLRNEKITYKIREHSLQKLPYQLIVGDKEMAAGVVAVRNRSGQDLGQMPLEVFMAQLKEAVALRKPSEE